MRALRKLQQRRRLRVLLSLGPSQLLVPAPLQVTLLDFRLEPRRLLQRHLLLALLHRLLRRPSRRGPSLLAHQRASQHLQLLLLPQALACSVNNQTKQQRPQNQLTVLHPMHPNLKTPQPQLRQLFLGSAALARLLLRVRLVRLLRAMPLPQLGRRLLVRQNQQLPSPLAPLLRRRPPQVDPPAERRRPQQPRHLLGASSVRSLQRKRMLPRARRATRVLLRLRLQLLLPLRLLLLDMLLAVCSVPSPLKRRQRAVPPHLHRDKHLLQPPRLPPPLLQPRQPRLQHLRLHLLCSRDERWRR